MNSNEIRLKERVKELKCLYELTKVAWEAKNDIDAVMSKSLNMLPNAMQHPALAEVSILANNKYYSTRGFTKAKKTIKADLSFDKKKFGVIKIGYTDSHSKSGKKTFLQEEQSLLKTVARELSLVIHRASVEGDKQNLQTQLQHVERLAFVGELSAGIAHELNEPLGRVLGFAQLIQKAGSLNEQQTEDLNRIIKASLYSREIIKKLMFFARQMPQQITTVDLNKVVDNILYFIDVRFQSRGIRLIKQLDKSLPRILADEIQMSQVVVNLITNSVYAMPDGGEILVITRPKGRYVSLIVKDTGTGMTKDVKDRIFEPFFTTKPVGKGTGLGLSVVDGIVASHHGKIVVKTAVGKGTRFEVRLPVKRKRTEK
jgi:signal transduction histidine kinase